MKPRQHDPLRLDVAAFAAAGAELGGSWPAAELPRWSATLTPPQDLALDPVAWHLRGERAPVRAGDPEIWLHLQAQGRAWLTCQRCLQPLDEAVAIDRRIRFVRDEATAEALDAESEDDVLAISRSLDARGLVEDELLLALPLVPRHARCPEPLAPDNTAAGPLAPDAQASAADGLSDADTPPDGRPNPFAVLAKLRRGPGDGA